MDGDLCTHLVLAGGALEPSGALRLTRSADTDLMADLRQLKLAYPHLRVLISIVPPAELLQPAGLSGSLQTADGSLSGQHKPEAARQLCARSAMDFLHAHALDGIDLDLEQSALISASLIKLLETLRAAILGNFYERQLTEQQHQLANGSGRYSSCSNHSHVSSVEPYLLTASLGVHENLHRVQLELRQLANLCDWLNVLAFDYYQFKALTPFTAPNAPLYPIVDPLVPILGRLSISSTLKRLINEAQLAADKIVLGISTYGRSYRLVFRQSQPSAAFSLALASHGGRAQNGQQSRLGYPQVCELLAKPNTISCFDERSRVPYLLTDHGYTWVSFESPESVREKVRFVLDHKLAGYFTWSLNDDDHKDEDAHRRWPLHRAMLEQISTYDRMAEQL